MFCIHRRALDLACASIQNNQATCVLNIGPSTGNLGTVPLESILVCTFSNQSKQSNWARGLQTFWTASGFQVDAQCNLSSGLPQELTRPHEYPDTA
jgi:hypothetical protein